MSFKYGDTVLLVRNTRNGRNAAYDRVKKGVISRYMVNWVRDDRPYMDLRFISPKTGKATSAIYIIPKEDVVHEKLNEKVLEDYL